MCLVYFELRGSNLSVKFWFLVTVYLHEYLT